MISETRMLNAETTVCNKQEDIEKLVHEIESKDVQLEELVISIEEMETKAIELEGLVQLLEVSFLYFLFNAIFFCCVFENLGLMQGYLGITKKIAFNAFTLTGPWEAA